jgi:hypothetical protein
MATRYWVGGSGSWTNSATANWAATSGGATGASAPTSVDDVIFDNLSNVGTTIFTVTVSTSAVCRNISFGSGATALDAVMTLAGSAAWSIYGTMTLVSTNLTLTYNGTITWASTTTGQTITTAGKTFSGSFTFNGVGGGWTLQDALAIQGNSGFNLLAGAVNTNNQTVTLTGGSSGFITSGTATRSLTLGTSTVSCSGIITAWNVSATTGFTLSAASSTITLTGAGNPFVGGGLTYNTVNANGNGSVTIDGANTITTLNLNGTNITSVALNAANIITTLNCTSVTTTGIFTFSLGADQTFTTLNLSTASVIRRIFLQSPTIGTTRTITSTTRTVSNVDFRDITFAGLPLVGTSLGDCGGNSNITFDTPKTVYWNLAGAQNYSATAWALLSGGIPALVNFPLAQDTAIFDDTGSVTGTITVNASWNIGTLNITKTGAMTLATGTTIPQIHKDLTLNAATTLSGTGTINFYGRNTTQTITSNGVSFTQPIILNAQGSTVNLGSSFTSGNTFSASRGTFDTSNYNFTSTTFSSVGASVRSIVFGTSTISLTGTGTVWNTSTGAAITSFSAASSTINLTNGTATARTFSAGNVTSYVFGNLGINGVTGSSTTTISGGAVGGGHTFNTISSNKTVAHSIIFGSLITYYVSNFTLTGTAGNIITITSNSAGSATTLSKSSGTVSCDYLSLKDSAATGGASWYAGANSTNVSGNTGWIFTAPPVTANTSSFFLMFP